MNELIDVIGIKLLYECCFDRKIFGKYQIRQRFNAALEDFAPGRRNAHIYDVSGAISNQNGNLFIALTGTMNSNIGFDSKQEFRNCYCSNCAQAHRPAPEQTHELRIVFHRFAMILFFSFQEIEGSNATCVYVQDVNEFSSTKCFCGAFVIVYWRWCTRCKHLNDFSSSFSVLKNRRWLAMGWNLYKMSRKCERKPEQRSTAQFEQ